MIYGPFCFIVMRQGPVNAEILTVIRSISFRYHMFRNGSTKMCLCCFVVLTRGQDYKHMTVKISSLTASGCATQYLLQSRLKLKFPTICESVLASAGEDCVLHFSSHLGNTCCVESTRKVIHSKLSPLFLLPLP